MDTTTTILKVLSPSILQYQQQKFGRCITFIKWYRFALLELKKSVYRSDVSNALKQYSTTRDIQKFFAFKKRVWFHFAVDQDEVFMTTKLDEANLLAPV